VLPQIPNSSPHTNPFRTPQQTQNQGRSLSTPVPAENSINGSQQAESNNDGAPNHGQPAITIPRMNFAPPNLPQEIQQQINDQLNRQIGPQLQQQITQQLQQQLSALQLQHTQALNAMQRPQNGTAEIRPRSVPSPDPLLQNPVRQQNVFQQVIAQQQQLRAAHGQQGIRSPSTPPTGQLSAVPNSAEMGNHDHTRIREDGQQSSNHVSGNPSATIRTTTFITTGNFSQPFDRSQAASHTNLAPPPDVRLAITRSVIEQARRESRYLRMLLTNPTISGVIPAVLKSRGESLLNDIESLSARLEAGIPTGLEALQPLQNMVQVQRDIVAELELIRTRNMSRHSPSPTVTPNTAQQDANVPEVFLLSGPTGPEGLVFSPSGTYGTAGMVSPHMTSALRHRQPLQTVIANLRAQSSHNNTDGSRINSATLAGNENAGQEHEPHMPQNDRDRPAQVNGQQAQQAQDGPQRPPNERAVALMGHVWLAIRLLFFLYMFSGGEDWRRPLIFGVIGLLVYLHNMGAFANHIERARRHFEALLPLPEERRREQQRRATAAPNGQEHGGQPTVEPTPERTAQRLVQERNEQGAHRIRDSIQMIERALALFVASLWPGLGERMVAAREERLRQQREEDEQRQRDAQAREAQEAQEMAEEGQTDPHEAQSQQDPAIPSHPEEAAPAWTPDRI
jgi:hypothetical protein